MFSIKKTGCSSDEGSAYVRLLKQIQFESDEFEENEDDEIFNMQPENNEESIENEPFIDDVIENEEFLTIENFADEFSSQNREVLTYFQAYEYANEIEMVPEDQVPVVSQNIQGLNFSEEDLYDFRRPDQSEDQIIVQMGENVERESYKYIEDLSIELGIFIIRFF